MFTTVANGRYALTDRFVPGDPSKGSGGAPQLLALPDGGFITAWVENPPFNAAVAVQRYDVDGNRVGAQLTLPEGQIYGAALLANGNIALATSALGFGVRILTADGAPVGDPQLVSTNAGPSVAPAIAALKNGGFVVSFTSANQKSLIQIFAADGSKVGGEIEASDANSYIDHNDVVGLANGNFVVSWQDAAAEPADFGNRSPGVRAQIFSPQGVKIGPAFAVNMLVPGQQDLSQLAALPTGGFIAVWRDTGDPFGTPTGNQGIWAQQFDSAGGKVGSAIHVSANGDGGLSPTVEVIAGTGFVVAWKSAFGFLGDMDVHARVYDFAGQPIGSEFIVDPDPQSAQQLPTLAVLTNGEIVVGWMNDAMVGSSVVESSRLEILYRPQFGTSGPDTNPGSVHRLFYDGLAGNDTITGSPQADSLFGNSGNDILLAGAGADVVDGGLGADSMTGGDGNDTYVVDDLGDVVIELANQGDDSTRTSLQSYTLASNVERLSYTGTTAAVMTGNLLDNTISGGPANDKLIGSGGTDVAVFGGLRGNYTITRVGSALQVADQRSTGSDGSDLLFSIETLRFSDGDVSSATLRQQLPVTAASEWRLFAASGLATSVGGFGTVFGTSGIQDISVLKAPGAVSFDPSFNRGGDVIHLIGNASDWSAVRSGSSVVLSTKDTIVSVPIGEAGLALDFGDGARTLRFNATQQTATIGSQIISNVSAKVAAPLDGTTLPGGADPNASGRLFLSEGITATAAGKLSIFGSSSSEDLTLGKGDFALDPSFNRGGDVIHLLNAAQSYTAVRSGSGIVLETSGQKITIPVGTNGLLIDFAGDDRLFIFDTATAQVLIDSQVITNTATTLIA